MDFDQIIYMLCEGSGKTRGNVQGGVDRVPEWRTVFLTNGEQPITSESSGGGAKSRVFEIECTEDIFEDPQTVANTVRATYGHVGPLLVELLKQTDLKTLEAMYQGCYDNLKQFAEKKQLDSGAMIMLGDVLFRMVMGIPNDEALTREQLIPFFTSKAEISIGIRAYEYLCGWAEQNQKKFTGDAQEIYGEIGTETDGSTTYNILMKVFNEEVIKAGFNPKAVKSELNRMGVLISASKKDPARTRRFGSLSDNRPQKCISLIIKDEEKG